MRKVFAHLVSWALYQINGLPEEKAVCPASISYLSGASSGSPEKAEPYEEPDRHFALPNDPDTTTGGW